MTLRRPLWMQASGADTPFSYSGQEFREHLPLLVDAEGVQNYQALRVHQRTAGANFTVEVEPGIGIVQGDSVSDQGMYLIKNTAVASVTVPSPPGAGSRTHRIIAQINDKAHDGALAANTYSWTLVLQEDTGAGTPALPNSAMALCTIVVAAGTGSITDSLIADLRMPVDYRDIYGLIQRSTGTNVPTVTLQSIPFTTETKDLWRMANLTTQNTRLTAPVAGVYAVHAHYRHNWTGTTQKVEIQIAVNGTMWTGTNRLSTATDPDYYSVSAEIPLAVNDYVQLQVYHTRASDITVYDARFSARWVAPTS